MFRKIEILYLKKYVRAPKNSLHRNIIIWKCHFQRYSRVQREPRKITISKTGKTNGKTWKTMRGERLIYIRFLLNDIFRWLILCFPDFLGTRTYMRYHLSRESDISERRCCWNFQNALRYSFMLRIAWYFDFRSTFVGTGRFVGI